jgi:hypothetical protein
MGFSTVVFSLLTCICMSCTISYWFVALHRNSHHWTLPESLTLVWSILIELLLMTAIMMVSPHDKVFTFVCDNCGNIDNDQQCCTRNAICCRPCTWLNRNSQKAPTQIKVSFLTFTSLNLLGMYLLVQLSPSSKISQTLVLCQIMQFYGFICYIATLVLYLYCERKSEDALA